MEITKQEEVKGILLSTVNGLMAQYGATPSDMDGIISSVLCQVKDQVVLDVFNKMRDQINQLQQAQQQSQPAEQEIIEG